MYEQLRNDMIMGLVGVEESVRQKVLRVLDRVSERYEIQRKEMGIAVPGAGLPEPVKIYLVCKKMAGLTDATLENYRVILDLFFREIRKEPDSVTTNDVRMWLYAYQQRKGISNRTLDKYREYINRFFTWAQNEGYTTGNPVKNVEQIRYEEPQRQALNQVELEYLRKACKSARELAIIEVLYSTGCRISEAAGLKKSDVDWTDKSVHLFGKGRKHRISYLNAKAEVALRTYLESRKDSCEYLFVSERQPVCGLSRSGLEKIVRNISEWAPIGKKVSPHILRHTTATTALQSGMPVEDISKLLGHESIDTTMIYAEVSMENVRAGHKKHIV